MKEDVYLNPEGINQNTDIMVNPLIENKLPFKRARSEEARNIRKEALLKAAKEIFFENGYRNITIKDITDRARVSIGTFYIYFDNKISIYKSVLYEGILQLEVHLRNSVKALDPDKESAENLLIQLGKAYTQFYLQNPEYFDIIAVLNITEDELRENHSRISKEIHIKAREILRFIESIIRLGNQKKEFNIKNTGAAATGIWALLEGILILNERKNLTLLKQNLDELVLFSMKSYITGFKI